MFGKFNSKFFNSFRKGKFSGKVFPTINLICVRMFTLEKNSKRVQNDVISFLPVIIPINFFMFVLKFTNFIILETFKKEFNEKFLNK
mmetsp:Transcript_16597/g.42002  ORF Transcript_16597/g.42002 Transcript_16597/m.42002 type:complete len:87 (-) Transcript_16597:70-330(-)